ncbi:hypothetical protein G4B88_013792 [Cannabis sativa]|nr:hypothetical protein G4B88_013792 [Cannabis sativa]
MSLLTFYARRQVCNTRSPQGKPVWSSWSSTRPVGRARRLSRPVWWRRPCFRAQTLGWSKFQEFGQVSDRYYEGNYNKRHQNSSCVA